MWSITFPVNRIDAVIPKTMLDKHKDEKLQLNPNQHITTHTIIELKIYEDASSENLSVQHIKYNKAVK